jgi:hypothetical protein
MGRPPLPIGTRTVDDAGYVRMKAPDHPLARDGWVREHTMVLYAKIGPGTHPCDGCSTPVTWGTTLEVDHLDWDRARNVAANLVPVCRGCNNRRRRFRVRKNAGRQP